MGQGHNVKAENITVQIHKVISQIFYSDIIM